MEMIEGVRKFVEVLASLKAESYCPFCGELALKFKDDLSRKEHEISGLCQECRDDTFKED